MESLRNSSDDELMEQVAQGDGEAFRLLVEKYEGLVRNVAYRMGLPLADVDDAAQQAFLRVWRSASTYRANSNFPSWLLVIVRNVLRNYVRDWRRSPFGNLEQQDDFFPNLQSQKQLAPDEQLKNKELGEIVRQAIAELPENQRLALVLHRLEGIPHETIAETLGVTVPAVKSLIHRAKENLQQKLAPYLKQNL